MTNSTVSHEAVVRKSCPWSIGWVEDVSDVHAQGASREALLEFLGEIPGEALEYYRNDALEAAVPGLKSRSEALKRRGIL